MSLWGQPMVWWPPLWNSNSFILSSCIIVLWGPMLVAEKGQSHSCGWELCVFFATKVKAWPSLELEVDSIVVETDVLTSCPWGLNPSAQPQGVWSESFTPAGSCLFLFTKTSVNSWPSEIQLKQRKLASVESKRNFVIHLNTPSD